MNIVFIGMSGSGKSTIGKRVAQVLKRGFYDTDMVIECEMNLEIDEIFRSLGQDVFRLKEKDIVYKISKKQNIIISTGGGVVLDPFNMKHLGENGLIIYLKGKVDTLARNLKLSDIKRPLLGGEDNFHFNLEKLYNERKQLYNNYSDYIIDINNKTVDEIVNEIIKINKNVES